MIKLMKKNGQVLLILILLMTAGLAIGITIISRSLSDISTSSKVEQSNRAFSAAEAAVEKALRNDFSPVNFSDPGGLSVNATLIDSGPLPGPNKPFFYDDQQSKEKIIHVWLCDPATLTICYTGFLNVYWGNSLTDLPALALTVISQSGSNYISDKYYFDGDPSRVSSNNFTPASCGGSFTLGTKTYQCKMRVPQTGSFPLGSKVLRGRFLYNSSAQPLAFEPEPGKSLPQQARRFTGVGVAGDTQRSVELFKQDKIVPFFFDYAIFSAGEITK